SSCSSASMIFCLVVEYALSSSIARLPAFDFWTTSCWSITAILKVSADNPGDTIASHNATAPIKPVTLVRSIESSSAPHSSGWFLGFVWLVWFVLFHWLVSFNQKPDRSDKLDEPD